MMQSMTGFASKSITVVRGKNQKATLTIHLKTLNSRYFETNIKLPHQLSSLETDLIKIFKKALYRGSIFFTAILDNPAFFRETIEPALETVKNYMGAIDRIRKTFEFKEAPSLDLIIQLPNVFVIEEQSLDKKSTQMLIKTVHELIELVIKERETEGGQLQKDLEKRLMLMKKEIEIIEKRYHQHMEEQKQKLHTLFKELPESENELAETKKSILYTLLDKIDINEEIVRFKSHLANISHLLTMPDVEKGKRLDFTLQELAREINTISAKCSDALISERAINVKVEIEKAREQSQNIV